jgi:DNA-binding beta-propeller fold protein YncE
MKSRKSIAGLVLMASLTALGAAATEEKDAPFATYRWGWGHFGDGLGQYRNPTDIAAYRNPIGIVNVIVADTGNARLGILTDLGAFLEKWGHPGAGSGQYSSPWGVAVDRSGQVFIADSGNHRVQRTNGFTNAMTDLAGKFLGEFGREGKAPGELNFPTDVAVDAAGLLYVVDSGNSRVQKLTQEGRLMASWGKPGDGPEQFDEPLGIALGPDGSVYVTDSKNHRVQKLDAEGRFVARWGEAGSAPGQFLSPAGIAVDTAGRVYVVDRGNDRVQVFDGAGRFLGAFGGRGTGKGQLLRPYGVAVDDEGKIYVTDTGNGRVQVFARP